MAKERFGENIPEFRLWLISRRERDGRQYNIPSRLEVAALVVGNLGGERCKRDVVIEHRCRGLERVSDLHPSFMSLQYPLLFPYGDDGFHEEIFIGMKVYQLR